MVKSPSVSFSSLTISKASWKVSCVEKADDEEVVMTLLSLETDRKLPGAVISKMKQSLLGSLRWKRKKANRTIDKVFHLWISF